MSDLSQKIANLPPDKLEKLMKQLAQKRQAPPSTQIPPRPATLIPLPLSFSQQRLWLLEQLEPGNPAYHLVGVVRLRGAVDISALATSLDTMMERHESLRTRFEMSDGQPVQVITPPQPFNFPQQDISSLPVEMREDGLAAIVQAESQRPFDLAHDVLTRVMLIRLAADEHILLLIMHHIISDGWSLSIFSQEVGQLYALLTQHQSLHLPPLPIQYADFAVWQRAHLQGTVLATQVEYWKAQLSDAPPLLDLPLDFPRAATQYLRSESLRVHLPASIVAPLRALSHATETTMFMVLLGAFKGLLSRLSGQDDVVVGTPIAGRHRRETEGLIGFFLNSLALRTSLADNPTFRDLISRVRDTALGAYSHQDLPFEQLLEILQPARDMSYTPVFQVFFNMLNLPVTKMEMAGLTVELLPSPEMGAKFDITLYAEEQGEEVELHWVYNADLFHAERMRDMVEQYTQLLAYVGQYPDMPLTSHSLVTPRSRPVLPDPVQSLNTGWSGSLPDAIRHWATETPTAVAIEEAGHVWTYADLEACSNQLAHALRASGVQSEEVVAVYAHRDGSLVWALMGILKAGAAFIILDPSYPTTRLVTYLEVAQPIAFISLEAAGEVPDTVYDWLARSDSRYHIALPTYPSTAVETSLSGFPTTPPPVEITPSTFACLTFTSGSTGNPKGVMGQHGSLTHFYPWMAHHFALDARDRFSMVSGLAHDPLQRDIFTPLWLGGTICIPTLEDISLPGRLAKWMSHAAISVATLTPALGQLLSEAVSPTAVQIPSLRYAFVVGDILTRRDVTRIRALAPGITCINLYGSTETQRAVGYYPVPDALILADDSNVPVQAKEVLALGKGMPDVQLLILNGAQHLAGVGERGEIYVRSPHIARGYLKEETLTAQRFLPNPFTRATGDRLYKTGDLGRYRPDGNVEFAGRADLQVQIRGFRIELGEIEGVLRQHPLVRDVVVITRDDLPSEGKYLVGYIVPMDTAQSPLHADLFRHVKATLPAHMVPSAFVTLDALPLTPNRKIDRRALPRPDSHSLNTDAYVGPRTLVEAMLVGIWVEVLGLKQVSIQDNFFELGGHSLLAMRVVTRIRDQLQIDLPFRRLFDSPTIATLAPTIETMLGEVQGMQRSLLQPVARDTDFFPTSFTQRRLWFLYQLDPTSPFYNIPVAVRVTGSLDRNVLDRALADLTARHEVLRTTFTMKAGEPVQQIHTSLPIITTLIDLRDVPAETRADEAQRMAREASLLPFNLDRGPLWRLVVIWLDDVLYTLHLTIHHIIADGWSMSVFTRDLLAFYAAQIVNQSATLPALTVQYADYAVWQRRWLQGEVLDAQIHYWKERLKGAPPLLNVRTDHPRPAVQTFDGAAHPILISPALTDALRTLCQREGATLFIGLLATFQVLLRWMSGQDDFVIGTDVAGRSAKETEPLVGCFVNQLPLRATFTDDPDFCTYLARCRQDTLDAYSYQDVPFDKLVEVLSPPRANYTPLVQIKLVLHNLPRATLELPDLTFATMPIERGTAQLDFQINLGETDGGLDGVLEYNTALFEKRTTARLVVLYTYLIEVVTTTPEVTLSQLAARLNQQVRDLDVAEQAQFKQTRRDQLLRRGRSGGTYP